MSVGLAAPRYRSVPLGGSLSAHFADAADGSTLVTSTEALQPYPKRLTDRLLHWAAVEPGHTLAAKRHQRSEEHTSELQSRQSISYAVFCL